MPHAPHAACHTWKMVLSTGPSGFLYEIFFCKLSTSQNTFQSRSPCVPNRQIKSFPQSWFRCSTNMFRYELMDIDIDNIDIIIIIQFYNFYDSASLVKIEIKTKSICSMHDMKNITAASDERGGRGGLEMTHQLSSASGWVSKSNGGMTGTTGATTCPFTILRFWEAESCTALSDGACPFNSERRRTTMRLWLWLWSITHNYDLLICSVGYEAMRKKTIERMQRTLYCPDIQTHSTSFHNSDSQKSKRKPIKSYHHGLALP